MNGPDPVRPVLDPIDRLSEVIFGLLMALSFTGTMSVAVGEGDKGGDLFGLPSAATSLGELSTASCLP